MIPGDVAADEAFAEPMTVAAAPVKRMRTFWLTRFVLLRFMGLVYFTAFLVAAQQMIPLVGHEGLTPAVRLLDALREHYGSFWKAFLAVPDEFYPGRLTFTIFGWDASDGAMLAVAWTGVGLSALVMAGLANALVMVVLWVLYMSIVGVGGLWFSYGWDIQILETGALAVFLCPLLNPLPFPRSPPPVVALWLFRWLIFRIMLGAFLIKWRNDPSWRDFTALYYHYETQPVPNPLSRLLYFAPPWFHKFGVGVNHFVEFIVPWFCFWPALGRNIAGLIMIGFQVVLITTGNLSFLNWLTIVPCIACIDDALWCRILPGFIVRAAERAEERKKGWRVPEVTAGLYACVVVYLSWWPVKNLFSEHQDMNASYDKLHLVGTYGAFGSMGKERYELVFEGTEDYLPDAISKWRPYEFKVKPGDPMRRPPVITPYHYRLDWQTWFQWFQGMPAPGRDPWPVYFVWKLLHNDPGTLRLLAGNPFPDAPPRNIRAVLYRYKFAPPGDASGAWWVRERLGLWLPEFSKESEKLRNYLIANGLIKPDEK